MRPVSVLLVAALCCMHPLANAQVVQIGSGVSIPVLSPANLNTYFTVSGGTITQNIDVVGSVEILGLTNLTFDGITLDGGNITFTDCSLLTFDGCDLYPGGDITLDDSYITFLGSTIEDWGIVSANGKSVLEVGAGSVVDGVYEFNSMIMATSTHLIRRLMTRPLLGVAW